MKRRYLKYLIISVIGALLQSISVSSQEAYNYVFKNGDDGYNCFRIPAIIKAPNNDLLAFCEARIKDCGDMGNIDLVLKRSRDNGKTWGPLVKLVDAGEFKAGDPAPVVDFLDPAYPEGRILFLYNTSNTSEEARQQQPSGVRELWYKASTDNGYTWDNDVNITASVIRLYAPDYNPAYNFSDDWRTMAVTPGHIFQIQNGIYKGRIVAAGNYSAGNKPKNSYENYRAFCFYTDDHGKTWKKGGTVDIPNGNESTAAELSNGSVLLNARYQHTGKKARILAFSNSGGERWDTAYMNKALPEPICQGSMISFRNKKDFIVLFSNPSSTTKREKMTIKFSKDDGKTWNDGFMAEPGEASYSDMVQLNRKHIGIIYERGMKGGIVFRQFNLKNILNAK